jgi:hypothetical protein
MLLAMISIPKLGSDPELFSLHYTVINGSFDALAHLLLITIVASRVETSVTGLNCIIHDSITGVFGDLPEAETHSWHSVARSKGKRWLLKVDLLDAICN